MIQRWFTVIVHPLYTLQYIIIGVFVHVETGEDIAFFVIGLSPKEFYLIVTKVVTSPVRSFCPTFESIGCDNQIPDANKARPTVLNVSHFKLRKTVRTVCVLMRTVIHWQSTVHNNVR